MSEEKKKQDSLSKSDSSKQEEIRKPGISPSPPTYRDLQDALLKVYANAVIKSLPHSPSIVEEWLKHDVDVGNVWLQHILLNTSTRPQVGKLEAEINKLKSEINQKAQDLLEQSVDAKQKETQISELKGQLESLGEKQRLSHLLSRVGTAAQQKLLDSPAFRSQFDRDSPCSAYVLSIDIRRSTELMLKARDPKLFAKFLMTLASQLRDVILENYGVFDKFTGDGILAFFPEFYSGSDAGYFALRAAAACHEVFTSHYDKHKHCFVSVLKDIGLGIGIDYGPVQIVQLGGDITVVGTPVVYACRMGGADARHTYLNQPAYEQLFDRYSAICDFDSCEIDIKHEGKTLAYSAQLNGKSHSATVPEWNKSTEPVSTARSETATKSGDPKKK